MNPRRARILGELGLVRYRLRAVPSPAAVTVTVSTTAPAAVVAVEQAGVVGPLPVQRALSVHVPDVGVALPRDGVAATIWRQVLQWLRLDGDDVEWAAARGAHVVSLPPSSEWSTPAGKRALWTALKSFASKRMQ